MHAAFGLALEVDASVEVPGILEAPEVPGAGGQHPTRVRLAPAELRRHWRPVERESKVVRELRNGAGTLLSVRHASSAGYLLHAPGFARVLVSADATTLLCEPESQGGEWVTLLTAQALPLAATLRGMEVLHASGVVPAGGPLSGQAVLISGPQGTGKSSLAAALLRRGAALLSDDTVAIEMLGSALIAHSGATLLLLRERECERLSTSERDAVGVSVGVLGKQRFRPHRVASRAPFGAFCLLERSAQGPAVERIEAIDPVALLGSTYNLTVRTPERLTRHLDLVAALAATGRIYRLRVQNGIDATRLADIVLESLGAR